ncbi:hypothetical protein MHK_002243, partial [Candidatus Magnetomorum sp. HK-1]
MPLLTDLYKKDSVKTKNDAINAMEQEKRAKEEALKEIER